MISWTSVRCAGEVGVDHDAVHVADDQQRRVLQGLAVLEELLVGRVEVLVLALVLPGEVAPLPDVGPAVAAAVLRRALLEGERLPGGVDRRGLRVADELAQVEEVLLGGGPLGEPVSLPLAPKLCDVHGGSVAWPKLSGGQAAVS